MHIYFRKKRGWWIVDVATFIDFLNKPEILSQILRDKPRAQFRKKVSYVVVSKVCVCVCMCTFSLLMNNPWKSLLFIPKVFVLFRIFYTKANTPRFFLPFAVRRWRFCFYLFFHFEHLSISGICKRTY